MAVDKRIELELVMRDTVSLTLKTIADNLDAINKGLAKSSGEKAADGSDAFKKIKETTEGIRRTSEEGAQEVTAHAERILPLAARLGSFTRLGLQALAAKYVTDAMIGQSQERLQLRALAQETNFGEDFISMLQQAQKNLGISTGDATENITKFGNALSDTAYGKGGLLSKALDRINEGELATTIENLVGAGKHREAAMAVLDRYETAAKTDEAQALRIASAFNMRPSFFKGLREELKRVKPSFQVAIAEATVMFNSWHDFLVVWENVVKLSKGFGVRVLNRTFDITGILGSIWSNSLAMNPTIRSTLGLPPLTAAELEDYKKRNETTLKTLQEILSSLQGTQNKQSIEKREAGGTVLAGRTYIINEKGPETFRSNAGWGEVFGGERGPRFFKPKTGGDIIPADPFAGEDWRKRMPLSQEMPGGSQFDRRFGNWPGYRWTEEGYMAHPRERFGGGTPEENWEALNRGLNSEFGAGVGISESETIEKHEGTAFDLRMEGRMMEHRARRFSGESEDFGWPQRGGEPFEPDARTGEVGEPINYRSMLDSELGGGMGGSAGFSPEHFRAGADGSFNREDFRRDIDSELSGGDGGSLGAEIEFRNVPPGVTTEAEGDGFDNFRVNKTRQLAGA